MNLVVQSSPPPFTILGGIVRSEVVGWRRGLDESVFGGGDEESGWTMERLVRRRAEQEVAQGGAGLEFWPEMNVGEGVRDGSGRIVKIL